MFIFKFLFLIIPILPIHIKQGEEKWFSFPLAESYEYQVMGGEGALSLRGYRELFESQGFKIGHWEIQRKIIILKDLDALKEWIALEMAPRLGVQGDPKFVETYFDSMQKMGWMELEEGRIGFPEEKLKVLLYKM